MYPIFKRLVTEPGVSWALRSRCHASVGNWAHLFALSAGEADSRSRDPLLDMASGATTSTDPLNVYLSKTL
jgi:hypothetical protein